MKRSRTESEDRLSVQGSQASGVAIIPQVGRELRGRTRGPETSALQMRIATKCERTCYHRCVIEPFVGLTAWEPLPDLVLVHKSTKRGQAFS